MRIIRLKLQVPTTPLSLDCTGSVKFSFSSSKDIRLRFFFTFVAIRFLGWDVRRDSMVDIIDDLLFLLEWEP